MGIIDPVSFDEPWPEVMNRDVQIYDYGTTQNPASEPFLEAFDGLEPWPEVMNQDVQIYDYGTTQNPKSHPFLSSNAVSLLYRSREVSRNYLNSCLSHRSSLHLPITLGQTQVWTFMVGNIKPRTIQQAAKTCKTLCRTLNLLLQRSRSTMRLARGGNFWLCHKQTLQAPRTGQDVSVLCSLRNAQ